MKEKKFIPLVIIGILISVSVLSGCVRPWVIDTLGWDHINDEGTAVRIWGRLKITENSQNWNEGFVWDIEPHTDWQDYQYRAWADNYGAVGLFSLEIHNLSRTTKYYYRAFGEYLKGQSQYGVGGETYVIPGGPRVTTENASSIGLTSVKLRGNMWHMGGASSCTVYFLYGTDENALTTQTTPQTMTATGFYETELNDLTTNTTIYYKAVAENDADTWAGLIYKVTPGRPVVITRQPAEIGKNHAILKGELWNTGGTETCNVWFAYGNKSPNQLDQTTTSQLMNATGPFQIYLGNLSAATKYWYRSVANNGIAQSVGDIYEFTTTPTAEIKTTGELGRPYNPFPNTLGNEVFQRLPPFYIKLLEKHPILLRFLQHPRIQTLLMQLH